MTNHINNNDIMNEKFEVITSLVTETGLLGHEAVLIGK
jgi:hypothetical protein